MATRTGDGTGRGEPSSSYTGAGSGWDELAEKLGALARVPLLVVASQDTNVKLRDVALQLTEIGELRH